MPFTPLHLGPGLAIKAIAGEQFSLLSFAVAQVAMDIEPLIGMIRGAEVLHGPTHTYLAALIIAIFVAIITPIICRPILRRWHRELVFYRLHWLITAETFAPIPIITGACIGTLSHIVLDSIMHADMAPVAPWSNANYMYGWITITTLYQSCLLAGMLGLIGWIVRRIVQH